jgi:hypothetical protein
LARKLRIGETITVLGNALDQDNTGALTTPGSSVFDELSDPDGAITLVDNMDQTADITADAPGAATVVWNADDILGSSPAGGTFAVEVLDAIRFVFALSDPDDLAIGAASVGGVVTRRLTPTAVGANCACVATAVDEQGLSHADYTSGLAGISWTRTGTAVSFDVGGGPVSSASGTLSLRLVTVAVGDSVVTLSATNASGDAISTTMNVRVMGAVTLEVVEAT